jgi:hypothetical protein
VTPAHYTDEDRARLTPHLSRVRDFMLDAGWIDADNAAKHLGMRSGTLLSKLRELCDTRHSFLGLAYDRKATGRGVHLYRLFVREPEQLTLLEGTQHG